jgi:hypothetical protein
VRSRRRKRFKSPGRYFASLLWRLYRPRFANIRIIPGSFNRHHDDLFTNAVLVALILLEHHDPRRLERVFRHISYIVNSEGTALARYDFELRACFIDFGRLFPLYRDPEQFAALLALIVVHEATHGKLTALGLPYTPDCRGHIERICADEERRCAVRLAAVGVTVPSEEMLVFDEAQYENLWNMTRWTRIKNQVRRIRESRSQARNESRR